ncbi:MAG: archease [Deltaproteobacteria bacterium CG23_combo_of_CG06-09_8_20_14_all_60_8]|nr:MAG: archease [Desulfobacterales bacterium CG2_30_60_27]PIP44554.1 MAG: archease [Deltaproteobacteria bacterium CG23_combo_of_CG06-09_8_20_14_all_60_8]
MTKIPVPGRWEHFHHMADIGVCGLGGSLAEAFGQAALAMTAVITDLASVRPAVEIPIRCQAPDVELLLVDWLNALIYEMAVRHMLFSRFQVTITDLALTARAWGEPVDRLRHQPAVEIKGATYTALKVAQTPDGPWLAQCVVDV